MRGSGTRATQGHPSAGMSLVTRNTALVLYGVLLVLPTLVLGGLHWYQLVREHQVEVAAVPTETNDAARRLSDALERRLADLLERESQRPFYHYKRAYFPPGTAGTDLAFVPSPLVRGRPPEGILAWFAFEPRQNPRPGAKVEPEIFGGNREGTEAWKAQAQALIATTQQIAARDWAEGIVRRMMRLHSVRTEPLELRVAAINISPEADVQCLRDELPKLEKLAAESLQVTAWGFHVRFFREQDGTPRIHASRSVTVEATQRLDDMPECFANLGRGASFVHGFYIDPAWLFGELPQSLSTQVLDVSQVFLPAGSPEPPATSELSTVAIRPVKELGFETYQPEDLDYGLMRIAVDTRDLEARFRSQSLHFLGVTAMLVLSLGTGMMLLLRSVRRDLETARRTENFVAAITHELRTPLSAIRLYGEMLEDGWVDGDPSKRAEYYRRIVRETGRLETLVERVLEKSQIASGGARPEPGDLNRVVEGLRGALCAADEARGERDLQFELGHGLPAVMLIPDSVRSIVTNLVENARKYAPVDLARNGAEPIRVSTRAFGHDVVLEVADRGPGIPAEERARIFEAFYRVGNETTRTARGTGLGLHLVALQSDAMGARVQVLDRPGGGTVFRVTFRALEGGETVPAALADAGA